MYYDPPPVDERTRRIGENEALFRDVNERVRAINDSFSVGSATADFVCECGNASCLEHVSLPLSEYERVRSDPTRFIIRPGHEEPDVEAVVEAHGDWHVVQKNPGEPGRIAEETDPRG